MDNTVSFDKMFVHGAAIFHHLRSLSIDFNFARCVTTSPQLHQDLPKQFAVLHRKENRGGRSCPLCCRRKDGKKKLCQTQKRRSEKTLMSKSQVAFCLHECSETKRAKMRSAWVAFEKSISKRCFLIPQTFWICLSWDEWSSDEKLHWFLPFCPQVGPSPTQSVRWVVLCRASLCRHQSSPWWPSLSKGQCLLTSVPWLKVTHSLRISHLPNFAAPWCQ